MYHQDSFSSFEILPYNKPRTKNEPMTLIVGARCTDGIVMVADRKITEFFINGGIDFKYQNKLFGVLEHVILGSSGNTAMFDLFKLRLMEYVKQNDVPIDYIITRVCEITKKTNEEYNYRYDTSFDVLVGIQYTNKISEITYINHRGEPNNSGFFYAIGSGNNYAKIFLNQLQTTNISMKQFAEIGYFIIKYIENTELDASIGVGNLKPQIWYFQINMNLIKIIR